MRMQALKCPNCTGMIQIEDTNREFCFCTYCGAQIEINSDSKKEFTYNKIINKTIHNIKTDEARITEAYYKDKESKRSNLMLGIIMIVCFLTILGGVILERMDRAGKISVGNHKDYEGENYKVVESQLKSAGFNNIELIDLDDDGWFTKDGAVDTISIGGNAKFEEEDYFEPSVKVVISYH